MVTNMQLLRMKMTLAIAANVIFTHYNTVGSDIRDFHFLSHGYTIQQPRVKMTFVFHGHLPANLA